MIPSSPEETPLGRHLSLHGHRSRVGDEIVRRKLRLSVGAHEDLIPVAQHGHAHPALPDRVGNIHSQSQLQEYERAVEPCGQRQSESTREAWVDLVKTQTFGCAEGLNVCWPANSQELGQTHD